MAYANFDREIGYVQGMNYIVALLLVYIRDEEQVFWCLHQVMAKYNWRLVFKSGFPKLHQLTSQLEKRLRAEQPQILEHLEENYLVIEGTFTGHFMTFGLNCCPLEISSRLFDVFVLDGEKSLPKVLLRMFELK